MAQEDTVQDEQATAKASRGSRGSRKAPSKKGQGNSVDAPAQAGGLSEADARVAEAREKFLLSDETELDRNGKAFEAAAKKHLGFVVPRDWTGQVETIGVVEHDGQLMRAEENEQASGYQLFARKWDVQPGQDAFAYLTSIGAQAEADALGDRLALIDAHSQPNEHEKAARLAYIEEVRVMRDPNSTEADRAAAKAARDAAEYAAMRNDPQLQRFAADQADGVTVALLDSGYSISTPFNRDTIAMLRAVEGANFDRAAGVWTVPQSSADALEAALPKIREENRQDALARDEIIGLAGTAARAVLAPEQAAPLVSDFHPRNVTLYGDVIGVNGRYAAQLTGPDDQGNNRIVLHRLSDLQSGVFKGERVGIRYGDKGRADVEVMRSNQERFDDTLGKSVEGVKVVQVADTYQVSFDYNPALSQRIQRVNGAEFDRESKTWTVGTDMKEFLARAVKDMREEYVADKADRTQAEQAANEKLDGAKVRDAYTADGQAYSGRVVAKNDRYVVQHTGREHMVLHRSASLSEPPTIGADVKVAYNKGRAEVKERTREHSQALERTR